MTGILDHVWGESPAADRVWAQVVGLSSSSAHKECLMVFQAYIDDSSRNDECFVLAGHVASAETWAAFSQEWESLLDLSEARNDEGKRRFKMQEMPITPEGMWEVTAFRNLVKKYPIVAISASISKSVYRATQREFTSMRSYGILDNIFIVLFRTLIEGFNSNRDKLISVLPEEATVNFIFDEQSEKRMIFAGWDHYLQYRTVCSRPLFGSLPRFEPEDGFMPLQAADLLAWWVRETIYPNDQRKPEEIRLIKEFCDEHLKQWTACTLHFSMERENILDIFRQIYKAKSSDFWRNYSITYR